jgi:hypothetical protein
VREREVEVVAIQRIWVHGNSGVLQVVRTGWGDAYPRGWGLTLVGNVQGADDHSEPWVQFHIPLASHLVEKKAQISPPSCCSAADSHRR